MRGRLVVADTENTEGVHSSMSSTMLVFPTPEGPEMTMSLPFVLLGEVLKEGLALV